METLCLLEAVDLMESTGCRIRRQCWFREHALMLSPTDKIIRSLDGSPHVFSVEDVMADDWVVIVSRSDACA